jgi:hypothetical protein
VEEPTVWKIPRKALQRFHICLVEDPDNDIVAVLVRRPPDYTCVSQYDKGSRDFLRVRRMYQASLRSALVLTSRIR